MEKELSQGKGSAVETKISKGDVLTPEQINSKLNDFVVGQKRAKKVLSVAVYNHYMRLHQDQLDTSTEHYEVDQVKLC